MQNLVDWELVREKVNDLDWNKIIRFPCPASSLNEALLRVLRDRVPKRTIVIRMLIPLVLMTGMSWVTM